MRKIIIAVLAVACLVPAMALAARPAKNSSFAWCTSKNVCPLVFDTNKKGKKITNMRLYTKCLPVPLMTGWPDVKVNRRGKFSGSGTVVNVLGEAVDYKFGGRFVKRKKAVGTFDVDRKGCSDKERKFVAKRKGPASGAGSF